MAHFFNGQKGMSDREGHGHKATVYKSHFPTTKTLLVNLHKDTVVYQRLINQDSGKDISITSSFAPTTIMFHDFDMLKIKRQ